MTRPDTDQKLATDVSTMFDEVSPRYDLINDVLSAGNSRLWRIALTRALQPRKGMRILDVAAGTGTSSAAIAAGGAHVTAADFSEGMLAEGRRRQSGNDLIEFVYADASKLPFDDDSFDAATISFGLRNVSDPKQALAEMRRVVKPGGRIVVCEFSRPVKSIRKPYALYSRHVLPRIAGAINKSAEDAYRYLNESIEQWPDQDQLAGWLRDAGLERVAYRNLTFGIVALHRGFVPHDEVEAPRQASSTKTKSPSSSRGRTADRGISERDGDAATSRSMTKSSAKKPAAKSTTAKRPSTAAKSTAAKTAASGAKGAAAKGAATKSTATKSTATKSTATKKTAASRKAAAEKPAKAVTSPKAVATKAKPAVKKTAASKPAPAKKSSPASKPSAANAKTAQKKPAAKSTGSRASKATSKATSTATSKATSKPSSKPSIESGGKPNTVPNNKGDQT